jgi:hypothetical protein
MTYDGYKQSTVTSPGPRNGVVPTHALRRFLAALRQAHSDATYLNRKIFDGREG